MCEAVHFTNLVDLSHMKYDEQGKNDFRAELGVRDVCVFISGIVNHELVYLSVILVKTKIQPRFNMVIEWIPDKRTWA